MTRLIRYQSSRWSTDDRGVVMIIVALAIVPLMLCIGLAVDSARGYMLQSQLSYAIDAAGLAAGRAFDSEDRGAEALMYFNANFPEGFMNAEIVGGQPTVTFDDAANQILIQASARIPTRFMSVAGLDHMTVSARTVIKRELPGLELVLVMDNTGSMRSGDKIGTMKDAATELVNILYGRRDEVKNFWVGVVPYVATVNIGDDRTDWLEDYDPDDFLPTSWRGCVQARSYPNDSNDEPPSTEGWQPHRWRSTYRYYWSDGHQGTRGGTGGAAALGGDNDWRADRPASELRERNSHENDGTGPNLGCGPAITSLVASKTTVLAAIDEMQPWHRGGTMANLGLAWGWRVISPRWRGLWGGDTPDNLPLDYATPNMRKAVIVLTDGVNEWYDWPGGSYASGLPGANANGSKSKDYEKTFPGADYTAYGRLNEARLGTSSNSGATSEVNRRMSELCSAMKAQDIIVYAITFQVSNSTTKKLYETCATSPAHYFNSPSNTQLRQSFQRIADELSNLRIAE